jgi:hypothetical protein
LGIYTDIGSNDLAERHPGTIWVAAGREETRLVFAQTGTGRYLLVVLATASDGRDFVVTARDMTDNERRAFTEKGR